MFHFENLKSLFHGTVGIGFIELVATVDPSTIEAIGKIILQLVISFVTIFQLLKKKEK